MKFKNILKFYLILLSQNNSSHQVFSENKNELNIEILNNIKHNNKMKPTERNHKEKEEVRIYGRILATDEVIKFNKDIGNTVMPRRTEEYTPAQHSKNNHHEIHSTGLLPQSNPFNAFIPLINSNQNNTNHFTINHIISYYDFNSTHSHGTSQINGVQKNINAQYIFQKNKYLSFSACLSYVYENPTLKTSSSGVFNVTPTTATVPQLNKPFASNEFFNFNIQNGFTSPNFSAHYEFLQEVDKDIHVIANFGFKPSIGKVDSGHSDATIGTTIYDVNGNSITFGNISFVKYGDYSEIEPKGKFIKMADSTNCQIGFSKIIKNNTYSASINYQQNPFRHLDRSELFHDDMISLSGGLTNNRKNVDVLYQVNIGLAGAVPNFSLGLGLSF